VTRQIVQAGAYRLNINCHLYSSSPIVTVSKLCPEF
jgi:hypothetical protein